MLRSNQEQLQYKTYYVIIFYEHVREFFKGTVQRDLRVERYFIQ